MPYSPLGRGFLSGVFATLDDIPIDDYRRNTPRFQSENFAHNRELVRTLERLAAGRGVTAAQMALAWVLGPGDDIIPIPGTKRRTYPEQNVAAVDMVLTREELAHLDRIFPAGVAAGTRYPAAQMPRVNR